MLYNIYVRYSDVSYDKSRSLHGRFLFVHTQLLDMYYMGSIMYYMADKNKDQTISLRIHRSHRLKIMREQDRTGKPLAEVIRSLIEQHL